MLEIIVGLLALFLGWLCFAQVSRVRALYSDERPQHSRFHGEKPLMIVPSALGVLFVLDGLALLTLAAAGRLQDAGMAGSLGMIVALTLVPVGIAMLVLLFRFTGRKGRYLSGSEDERTERIFGSC
ncbi:MAG TPA: hypothetical protein VF544_11585 [Pyrinomonadaceae bacterium]|jgi:hypothetical protein